MARRHTQLHTTRLWTRPAYSSSRWETFPGSAVGALVAAFAVVAPAPAPVVAAAASSRVSFVGTGTRLSPERREGVRGGASAVSAVALAGATSKGGRR